MIWLLLALGLLLRTISLNQSFWLDEAAQAVLSRTPILNVNYAADFQPPLYYILGHLWMQLGSIFNIEHVEWFLRLPSVLFGVATIYTTYLLGQRLFSKNAGLLAAGFLAIAPFHIYYSQEFRMYALLTFLCALCWHELIQKRWMVLSLLISLSLFTHYFAFVNVIVMGIYLLTSREKRGFGYVVAGLLPFSLWLPTLLAQIATANQLLSLWPKWSEVSNAGFFKFLPLLAAKWTVGMISPENRMVYAIAVGMFVSIAAIAGLFYIHAMAKQGAIKRASYRALIYYGIVSVLIAWLGGLWLPAATPTRIQFVLPAIYLIIAQGCIQILEQAAFKKISIACIAVFFILQLSFSAQYLFNNKHHREDWRGAIDYADTYISSHDPKKTIAITIFNNKWAPMDWYSRYPHNYSGGTSYDKIENVMLFTYLFEVFDANRSVEHRLLKDHELVQEKDFRGVGIVKTFIHNGITRTEGSIKN